MSKSNEKHKTKWTTFWIWAALLGTFFLLFAVDGFKSPLRQESYDVFRQHISQGRVAAIRVQDNQITVQLNDGSPDYLTLGVVDDEVTRELSERGARVMWGEPPRRFRLLLTIALPLVLLLLFLVYFVKKANSANSGMFSMGKSRARLVKETRVTFDDVGGCDEVKELLSDVIDFLRNTRRWAAAGARLPRGVLLEGPPGCGKTLLARAVAGETQANFYSVSASEFVELFVGVGAARVRDMFEVAAKNAPAVIFVDELDAVGRRRGSGIGLSHDEREQTLNQLLVNLDGFERNERVVVIAATNRSDILDPALLRPGRFDRRIVVPALSYEARLRVLQIHTRGKPLADDLSLEELARQTEGFSGAQLENLANEAALLAVRRARRAQSDVVSVTNDDFQQAMRPHGTNAGLFDRLDTVLIESVAHLAQPKGAAITRVVLDDGSEVTGHVVWADAAFMKIRQPETGEEAIVLKQRIRHISALVGTDTTAVDDAAVDAWVQVPKLM